MEFETDTIVRIVVGLMASLFLIVDFLAYCKMKLNEQLAFGWGIVSVILLLMCIVPAWSGWSRIFTGDVYAVIIVVAAFLLWVLFGMSQIISQLSMKTQELAIQVSLLNCENERMLSAMREVAGKDVMEAKEHEK